MAVSFVAVLMASAAVAQIEEIKFMELTRPAYRVALSARAMALIHPDQPVVVIHKDPSRRGVLDKPDEVKVGATPIDIAHKRLGDKGYFLVLCMGERTLYLIDDQALAVQAKIPLKGPPPVALAATSSPTSPVVFYAGLERTSGKRAVHRVELNAQVDQGPLALPQNEDCGEIAVSHDGSILYARRPGANPAGLCSFAVSAEQQTPIPVQTLVNDRTDSQRYVPDPFGQYVGSGKVLYSAELGEPRTLAGAVVLFLPDKPVFFTWQLDRVTAYSSNTIREWGSVGLPNMSDMVVKRAELLQRTTPVRAIEGHQIRFDELQVMYCHATKNIFLVRLGQVTIVPLSAFGIKEEMPLVLDVRGPKLVDIDSPAIWKLNPRDPRIKVELGSAPEGMKLSAGQLAWTPSANQVGAHRVALRLSAGEIERTQEIRVTARRSTIELPFIPTALEASPDGKAAVALISGRDRVPPPPPDQDPGAELALVDLDKLQVTARRSFASSIHAVAVDGEYAYAAMTYSHTVYVLSRKDLSDVRRIFTEGSVRSLTAMGNGLLVISDRTTTAYDKPDFKPLEHDAGARAELDRQSRQIPGPRRVGSGWLLRGAFYDADLKTAKLLLTGPVPSVSLGNPKYAYGSREAGREAAPWGVFAMGGLLVTVNARTIGTASNVVAGTVLPDIPAAAMLVRKQTPDHASGRVREVHQVILHDLQVAAAGEPLTLCTETVANRSFNTSKPPRLLAFPGRLVAQVNNRLYVLPTARYANWFIAPLHFAPDLIKTPAIVLDPVQPTTIPIPVAGGKAPLEYYALGGPNPALTFDKARGTLTIDPAVVVEKAVEALAERSIQVRQPDGSVPSTEQLIANLIRTHAEGAAPLLRREPNSVVVAVPFHLGVRDAEQQEARIRFFMLLEVPQEALAARLRKLEEARPPTRPANPQDPNELQLLRARVRELETRNAQLEAQVQRLRDPIGGRAPATRPAP